MVGGGNSKDLIASNLSVMAVSLCYILAMQFPCVHGTLLIGTYFSKFKGGAKLP